MDRPRLPADRLWQAYLVVALVPLVPYYLIAGEAPHAVYDLFAFAAGIAFLLGIRIHRPAHALPWYVLAVAVFAWAAGDLTWDVTAAGVGRPPFPGLLDFMYVVAYGCTAAGLVGLLWVRLGTIDWRGVVDAAIVALIVAAIGVVVLVAPLTSWTDASPDDVVGPLLYPVVDLGLIALAVPLVTLGNRATGYAWLLILGLAATLAADVAFSLTGLDRVPIALVGALYLSSYAMWGAAALHPSMAATNQPSPGAAPRLSPLRIGGFVGGLSFPAILVVLDPEIASPIERAALGILFAGVAVLAYIRLADLVGRLAREEETHRTLVDGSADGIFLVIGTPPVVAEANPAAHALLGYPADTLVGMQVSRLVPAAGREQQKERLARLRRTKEPSRSEIEVERADGSPIIVELSQKATSDGAIVGVMHDVAERRALETELRHAQKMEAVGQLAGGMAHDFNNLLTAIRGFSEMMLESAVDGDRVDPDDIRQVIVATDRAATLTRQMLDFSRRQTLRPIVFDPASAAAETIALLRPAVGESVEIVLDIKRAGTAVLADRQAFEQVLLNLAVNARDAMPNGGCLTLTVDTRDVRAGGPLAAEGAGPGRYARLTVSDTGTGMDEQTRSRAFEPFFTTKTRGRGTGLGLASVYGIVRQSGGFVTIESALGVGTRVGVHLPLVDQPLSEETPPAEHSTVVHHGTILVVDDQPDIRTVTRHLLARRGYVVIEAATAAEAIARIEDPAAPVDLLLTDVVMPGMGGRELAERARRSQPGLRVLFMSGFTEDSVRGDGTSIQPVAFLAKPFSAEALEAAVVAALAGEPTRSRDPAETAVPSQGRLV